MERYQREPVISYRAVEDSFDQKELICRYLIICFVWMTILLSCYGLSYVSGSLYGNFIVNNLLSLLVEFPAAVIPIFMIDRWGRKRTLCLFMFLGGLSCVSTIFTKLFLREDLQTTTTVLAMLGKCCVTAGAGTFYIFSLELFPTVVRNMGFGICYGFARVGAIISPFVTVYAVSIDKRIGYIIPVVIIGALTLTAAISGLWLPETLNQNLPETAEDAINMKKKKTTLSTVEGFSNESFEP